MIFKLSRKLFLLLVVTALAGCASTGNKVDSDKVGQIEKGITTESDIKEMFGEPNTVMFDSNGNKTLVYSYAKAQSKVENFIPYVSALVGGSTGEHTTLSVMLDQKTGKVKEYHYIEGTSDTDSGLLAD